MPSGGGRVRGEKGEDRMALITPEQYEQSLEKEKAKKYL